MPRQIIDVSKWNGTINWDDIKKANTHAIIRLGWFGQSNNSVDAYFVKNAAACKKRDIPFGVYIYNYVTSEARAKEMAKWVDRQLRDWAVFPEYGIYLDLEVSGTEKTSKAVNNAFYETLKGLGWSTVGLYTSYSWMKNYLNGAKRDRLWLAHWNVSKPGMNCDIWQYSDAGIVKGVNTKVDMNWGYFTPGEGQPEHKEEEQAIKEDGIWGPATTRKLQKYLGTKQDGIVSSQYIGYRSKNPGLSSASWDWVAKVTKGSTVIEALQVRLKCTRNGQISPETVKAIQKHVGTTEDGYFSKPSPAIKKMQQLLNKGEF